MYCARAYALLVTRVARSGRVWWPVSEMPFILYFFFSVPALASPDLAAVDFVEHHSSACPRPGAAASAFWCVRSFGVHFMGIFSRAEARRSRVPRTRMWPLSPLSTRTCVRECVTGPGAHIPGLCEVLLVTAAAAVLHAITQLAPPPPYSLRVPSSFRLTVSRLPPRDKSFLDLAHLGLHAANASVRPITSTCPTPFVIFVAS